MKETSGSQDIVFGAVKLRKSSRKVLASFTGWIALVIRFSGMHGLDCASNIQVFPVRCDDNATHVIGYKVPWRVTCGKLKW